MIFFNNGTPKTINFPFGTNGKLIVLGAQKLKYFFISGMTLDNYLKLMIFHCEMGLFFKNDCLNMTIAVHRGCKAATTHINTYTVELQWLDHLWDHENFFRDG